MTEIKEFKVVEREVPPHEEKPPQSNDENIVNQSNQTPSTPPPNENESPSNDENSTTSINPQTNSEPQENLNNKSKNSTLSQLEKYLFNPQTLLYIILIILSLIFISLKLYKIRFFTLIFSLALLGFYFGGCLCPISYIGKLF